MANINSVQGNPIVLGMTGLDSDVHAKFDSKMDVDGYYPMDGITGGGPLDTAAWTERACPGSDGPARIESIHGRTVVWNQMTSLTNRDNTSNGVTFVHSTDGTITANGTATNNAYTTLSCDFVQGHKYLIKGCPANGSASTYHSYVTGGNPAIFSAFVDTGSGAINTALLTGSTYYVLAYVSSGTTVTNLVFKPQLFDLTRMFGAGNEPSTVAEFEELYPDAYYPYDAGSLQPVRMTGVESVGDGWTFQRAIDAGVLRGAGSVYDELTATERIVRVGVVDLGTLKWTRTEVASGVYCFYSSTFDRLVQAQTTQMPYFQCAKYQPVVGYRTNLTTDKTISEYNAVNTRVAIRDDSYTDAEAFKSAMQGVMLHYALATPTTTPIDPALNLTYRAAQGGTERILHDEPTAPPTMVVQYGSTADGIRDRALAAIATLEGSVSQHNYSVGDYLTFDGHLCRVTVAIATGESIVIGSNVAVTTVMEEVLSLLS